MVPRRFYCRVLLRASLAERIPLNKPSFCFLNVLIPGCYSARPVPPRSLTRRSSLGRPARLRHELAASELAQETADTLASRARPNNCWLGEPRRGAAPLPALACLATKLAPPPPRFKGVSLSVYGSLATKLAPAMLSDEAGLAAKPAPAMPPPPSPSPQSHSLGLV